MKYTIKTLTALVTLLLCGCVKDPQGGSGVVVDQVEVTLNLSVPGKSTPRTRGLTVQDESQVQQLDVLVFLQSGSTYTYAYHTAGVLSGTSTPTDIRYTLTLQNSKNGANYLLVFLANLSDRVNAVVNDLTGLSKDAALARITFDADRAYVNSSGAVVRYLPMWGEFGPLQITPSLSGTNLGTVNMLRSVASVDVAVNMGYGGIPEGLDDKFYIRAVSLANGQAKGLAAPNPANFNPTGGTGYGIVIAPSLTSPANMGAPVTVQHTVPDFGSIREIYVPEAENSTTNPISIIVEGVYIEDGGMPWEGESSFYRIELIHNNDRSTAQNLLRNHRYFVNILDVHGPGYQSFDIALEEPPVNLITQLVVVSEQDINFITYNESYMLGVNVMELTANKDLQDLSILILTNHPGGWTAKLSSSPTDPDEGVSGNWLRFVASDPTSTMVQGSGGTVIDRNFTVTALTAGNRQGYMHISVGPLKLVVTIYQSLTGS